MSKKLAWTQTPEGRARMSEIQKKIWAEKRSPLQRHKEFQKIAKAAVKVKRGPYKSKRMLTRDAVSVVINGWRITLNKDEVKIEHE
jgi:hypothetical protein